MKDKEKLILRFLKEKGRSSTTRIAVAITSNSWMAQKYLNLLLKKNLIVREKETKATYWRLNK